MKQGESELFLLTKRTVIRYNLFVLIWLFIGAASSELR